MKLLIATNNAGKVREYAEMFAALPFEARSLADVGLGNMTVEEPYATFEENAAHKARAYAQAANMLTLADDSGLEVAALDNRPGVYTARYAEGSDRDRYMKLLGELEGIPDAQRGARFVCVIALAQNDKVAMVRGECVGHIAQAAGEGAHGFGFDPVFIPAGYDVTFNALPPEIKHSISHRGRATQMIVPILKSITRP
jgi:XTP/dITP diphosphohydrolase